MDWLEPTPVDAHGREVDAVCPACGETVSVLLDPADEGELVQDCEVCCRPWSLRLRWRRSGEPEVDVELAY